MICSCGGPDYAVGEEVLVQNCPQFLVIAYWRNTSNMEAVTFIDFFGRHYAAVRMVMSDAPLVLRAERTLSVGFIVMIPP